MNRLRAVFGEQVAGGRRGLLPYVTAGYPDFATTIEILRRIDARRCLCAELGVPFSDPIADGPVIQASFSRALATGFRLDELFATIERHRDEIAVPLIAMVSYSIVYRRGSTEFVRRAQAAGIDGLIVPDLALEEADELAATAQTADCPLIMMVAPTSTAERRQRIASLSEPFIYYQSVTGITGERDVLPPDLVEQVKHLRAASQKPVCIGFGISRPEQVSALCAVADGAIVGSALVRRITAGVDQDDGPQRIAAAVAEIIRELTSGLPEPPPAP
jgi:tryptophan synthase alpha chain